MQKKIFFAQIIRVLLSGICDINGMKSKSCVTYLKETPILFMAMSIWAVHQGWSSRPSQSDAG